MAYGSLLSDVVQSSTAGTPPQFNDGNGTQVGTLCRAWVNFNPSSGSISIRASFNVSSVSYTGTGQYVVNFTNALSDANYSATACVSTYSGSSGSTADYKTSTTLGNPANTYGSYSTTSIGVNASSASYGTVNPIVVSLAVFR